MTEFIYSVGEIDKNLPQVSQDATGWVYENLLTRVTARGEGGVLRTPLPRPSFAGLELAQALRLPAAFLARYAEANTAATAAAATAPRLRRQHGEAWWRYMTGKGALRLAWPTVDIQVLDLLLFREKASGEVARVLVWPERVSALVIPDAVDYVAVRPDLTRLPAQHRPPGLIRLETVLGHLGDRVQHFDDPLPHWLYRGGDSHAFVVRSLRSASARPPAEFAAVHPDQAVDG